MDNFTNESKIYKISNYFSSKKYIFYRLQEIESFYEYLFKHKIFVEEKENIQFEIIKNLEKSCYKSTLNKARKKNIQTNWSNKDFVFLYEIVCGRVLAYLSHLDTNPIEANINILDLLDDNSIAEKFPFKTHEEFFPKEYKKLYERNNTENQKIIKFSKLRKCPKCKKNISTIKNVYNRSLDEGTNQMATCINCNYKWTC